MSYKPRMPEADWAIVRDFVIACVLDADFSNTKYVREYMRPLAALGLFGVRELGLPLTQHSLLQPSVIRRFASMQTTAVQRGTFESRLLQIREAHGGERAGRVFGAERSLAVTPLSPLELREMSTYVQNSRSEDWRRAGLALMGLSGGAGLRRKEVIYLRTTDINSSEDGYFVRVAGEPDRTVVVRREFEPYLARALRDAEADEYAIFPWLTNQASREEKLRKFHNPEGGRLPDASRLRATWLAEVCSVLTAGELVYAAGFKHLSSLDQYEAYFTVPDHAELATILRDPRTIEGAK